VLAFVSDQNTIYSVATTETRMLAAVRRALVAEALEDDDPGAIADLYSFECDGGALGTPTVHEERILRDYCWKMGDGGESTTPGVPNAHIWDERPDDCEA
jgi:hypothetical protein